MNRSPASLATSLRQLTVLRKLALAAGLVLLAVLWLGPLPGMARTAFSPHMILHLGIIVVGAPLLAFAITPLLPPLREMRSTWSWALLASVFDMVVVWGWHVPLLHAAAAQSAPVLAIQQLSFLAAGLAVWTVAFNARSQGAIAVGALVLFLTFMHMSMFGLVITLAPGLLYAPDFCLGAFGLSSLNDQRLGGILMAICGGLPYLFGTAFIAYRFLEAGNGDAEGGIRNVLPGRV